MLKLWQMADNEDVKSQFESNYVGEVDLNDFCRTTGVQYYHFDDADNIDNNDEFKQIKVKNGYTYEDRVTISPQQMGPAYENKLKIFYTEHLHSDDEIRFILDGSGYFDLRDKNDKWIRMWTKKGDMIVIPAGSYHRFSPDENQYIQALRLFIGEPLWTPVNRPADIHPSRLDYLRKFKL